MGYFEKGKVKLNWSFFNLDLAQKTNNISLWIHVSDLIGVSPISLATIIHSTDLFSERKVELKKDHSWQWWMFTGSQSQSLAMLGVLISPVSFSYLLLLFVKMRKKEFNFSCKFPKVDIFLVNSCSDMYLFVGICFYLKNESRC